eukprot:3107697-Prymnesium_polylepis.1
MAQPIVRGGCRGSFIKALKVPQCGVQLQICRNSSHICPRRFADETFDYIFVDALHDRKAVLRDLRVWWPKLKFGGIMAGDDYLNATDFARRAHGDAATAEHVRSVVEHHRYARNYDGTIDTRGGFTKGAVDDFFACKVTSEDDVPLQPDDEAACPHHRVPTVFLNTADRTFHSMPDTWAVRK